MRKVIVSVMAGLFVMSAGLALAEGPKIERKPNQHEMMIQRMTKDLDLTPAQQQKVDLIIKEDEARSKVIIDKMMADMKANSDSSEQKVKALLTPDQLKKYDNVKREHRQKMEEMQGKRALGRGLPPPQGNKK